MSAEQNDGGDFDELFEYKGEFNPAPIREYLGLDNNPSGIQDPNRLRFGEMLLQGGYATKEELARVGILIETPRKKWEAIEKLCSRDVAEGAVSSEANKPRHLLLGVLGPLGVGKTELAKQLVSTWKNSGYPIVRFQERYPENGFLEEFYKNPSAEGVAFKSEIFFLIHKVDQLEQGQRWLRKRSAVVDPAPEMDYIFALAMTEMGFMNKDEFALYADTYNSLMQERKIVRPDFYLVVNAPPSVIRGRIQHRGRSFEQRILAESPEYIDVLSSMVEQFSWSCGADRPAIRIDSSHFNYVSSPQGASAVVQEVGNWIRYYNDRSVYNHENKGPTFKIPKFI